MEQKKNNSTDQHRSLEEIERLIATVSDAVAQSPVWYDAAKETIDDAKLADAIISELCLQKDGNNIVGQSGAKVTKETITKKISDLLSPYVKSRLASRAKSIYELIDIRCPVSGIPIQEKLKKLFVSLADVQEKPKRYLYKSYFPLGAFSVISADPGVGKSKVLFAVAAKVTTGDSLLGIPCEKAGNVLIFSREDDASDIRKTIAACGGDLAKLQILSDTDDAIDLIEDEAITFGSPIVEAAIESFRPSLVIFDPYQKYIGSNVDTNTANKLSAALAPLVKLARKYDCHIAIIAHNVKAQTSLQYKFMGSVDLIGEARSGISIVRDPDHPEENIALHVKSNNKRGLSIRYKIVSIPGDEDFAKVEFLGLEKYTEQDYAEADRRRLSKKYDVPITDNDVIVKTILALLKENPAGLRVGKSDLQQSAEIYFNEPMENIGVRKIEVKYAAYMMQAHGVSIQEGDSQNIVMFKRKGSYTNPVKGHDRVLHIWKKGYTEQIKI